jgi:hypothetical protein
MNPLPPVTSIRVMPVGALQTDLFESTTHRLADAPCAYRKSNPDILVMQSAEDWAAKNTPCPFYGSR